MSIFVHFYQILFHLLTIQATNNTGVIDLTLDWYALTLANIVIAWRKDSTGMLSTFAEVLQTEFDFFNHDDNNNNCDNNDNYNNNNNDNNIL